MGRGAGDTTTAVAPRRVRRGRKGLEDLKQDPRFEGWYQCNNRHRFDKEQVVWTATEGFTADHGLVPMVRIKRNVTLAIEHENEHLIVWEEVYHPSGVLGHRMDCGTDPELAAKTFEAGVERMKTEYSDVGSMPEETHLVSQGWIEALVASRFRNIAGHEIRAEVEERKRQVEREAQVDRDELAARLLKESGYDPALLGDQV